MTGSVTLVGGGPGSDDLITVGGARALADADVVLFDRLAPHDNLATLAPKATLINVGKQPGHHAISQGDIEKLLVEHALGGAKVVRLKGGDPYVFGRGSEEVVACHAAGVPVVVIPGVSSAIAVPAAAGIPLTHRTISHLFTVVSGHAPLSDTELEHLAGLGGTIVVLMGVANLPPIVQGLARFGLAATTPVAIIERGFSDTQATTITSIADAVVDAAQVTNPAVLVIGDVVRLAYSGDATAAEPLRPRRGTGLMTDADEVRVPAFGSQQLVGFRIGVTSDRRSEDLIDAFERRGATVMHGPTLRIAHAHLDNPIIDDTRAIIDQRPDVLLATTAYGIRRWFEVADAAGIGDELTESLQQARILVRGPKARGGIRAAGLNDSGMSAIETTESLVSMALAECEPGLTVAVQLHGKTDEPQLARLREHHTVLTVAPYRWTRLGSNDDKVQRLIDAICARQLDAVTFTSAPAVEALFSAAESLRVIDPLVRAFQTDVLAASVGPVTSAPLLARGVTPIQPERYRMGALIRQLCEHLETIGVTRVATRHGELELRGQLVVIGDKRILLPPTSLTLLRQLVATPGAVLSRAELASALPGIQDDHAMEVAISRLRQALGVAGLVATVVKRGYRLDV